MQRIKTIFIDEHNGPPQWQRGVETALGDRHDLAIYDPSRPLSDQFEDRQLLIDLGGTLVNEMLEAAPNAKLWQMLSVGYDRVDLSTARRLNIPVAHCPGSTSAIGLGESAMMFILMLSKRYAEAHQKLKEGVLYEPGGTDLEGRVLGLIGFGASGQALAQRAVGFGLKLMIVEPLDVDPALIDRYKPLFVGKPDAIDRIMAESDFVSLHLPLTAQTRGLIDAQRIGLMKPTARFINVARGALVDEAALHQALVAGRIAGVGTDVFYDNKLGAAQTLLSHPNFVATPHVAGTTDGTHRRRAEVALGNADRMAQGLELEYLV